MSMSDTKERLIKTATDLFLGKGYGAVGTAEICAGARVNKGTFYHFFPSKSALLIATIEHYSADIADKFEHIARTKADPGDKLKALFRVPAQANRSWRELNGFAQGCLLGNVIVELGTVDAAVRQASHAALRQWEEPIETIVAEFSTAEGLPFLNPAKGARCIVAMLQGGVLMSKLNNDPDEITAMAPAAIGALRSMALNSEK